MSRYQSLLGKHLEVQYRAADLSLTTKGTLVEDSGKSIFLEERFNQRGRAKTLRVEIPYPCILRVSEASTSTSPTTA